MNRKAVFWMILFITGILTILFRMNISRYISDLEALFAVGIIVSIISGLGLLLDL